MKVTTFLVFTGRAEEAMNFHVGLLPGSGAVSRLPKP